MYRLHFDRRAEPRRHWNLPDRVFFACGACHILAYAFLERHARPGLKAEWIKPAKGFSGNHIFVSSGNCVFDYHGYSRRDNFFAHLDAKAQRWQPGWRASLTELPPDALVSEEKSKSYDGLWLRAPEQFIYDALLRARGFLARFPAPPPA
jgi:hypothetical protein